MVYRKEEETGSKQILEVLIGLGGRLQARASLPLPRLKEWPAERLESMSDLDGTGFR